MALIDFASSPHGGKQKLLPEWQSQPYITPVLILDHSIVGSANGAYWYFHDSTGIESHFILCGKPSGTDGEIWQLMDTGREADANQNANNKAISIETEDNGDPDDYPWSEYQLDSLIWLHDTLVKYHPTIKRLEANDCDGPGLGYHSKMGAPSCWTPSAGKTCPGKPVRVDQWNKILLPAFLYGEKPTEDDMPYTAWSDKDKQALMDDISRMIGEGKKIDGTKPSHLVDRSSAEIRHHQDLIRVGDRAGGDFDTHDSTSIEGAMMRLSWLIEAVEALAAAGDIPLPPRSG